MSSAARTSAPAGPGWGSTNTGWSRDSSIAAANCRPIQTRGLLCLDALRCKSAAEAAHLAESQRAQDYNPFNLLIASRDAAFVAYNRTDRIEMVELTPGLHLLTNLDVNDFECPRISASYNKFAALGDDPAFRRDPVGRRSHLALLLADHQTQLDARSGRPNSICLHLDSYGTRCSSLIFIGREWDDVEHYFAPGPPCRTAYEAAEVPDQSSPGQSSPDQSSPK
jgi:uncharacterized protein with NRDE domain